MIVRLRTAALLAGLLIALTLLLTSCGSEELAAPAPSASAEGQSDPVAEQSRDQDGGVVGSRPEALDADRSAIVVDRADGGVEVAAVRADDGESLPSDAGEAGGADAPPPRRALLADLTVTGGAIGYTLWPRFSGETDPYTVVVPHAVTRITIAGAAEGDATIAYWNGDGSALIDTDVDTDGLQVDLHAPGAIRVDVVAALGGDSRTYSVLVVRQGEIAAAAPCAGLEGAKPTSVAVAAVPIVVESTTADYFVLYARTPTDGGEPTDVPVSLTLGREGATTLAENVAALAAERYRVEKFRVAEPRDIDGDCIDDITELMDPVGMNPLNAAPRIEISDGAAALPDREAFDALSYQKEGAPHGFESVKFVLLDMDSEMPRVYFMNAETHRYHADFRTAFGLSDDQSGMISGTIIRHPNVVAVNDRRADYHYEFWPYQIWPYETVERAYTVLAASMPLLHDNLAYYMPAVAIPSYRRERERYQASRVGVLFDEHLTPESGFVAMNAAVGYGLLRVMQPGERHNPRDVLIYEALPNELSRVAGIITTVPQTPLAHVNLRAVQDGIPNAFVRGAPDRPEIGDLVGSYVRYAVHAGGWSIRGATRAEVDQFYASSRPEVEQIPQRDLSIRSITSLDQIGFEDWTVFGVKAANLAALGRLGFPPGTVPDGFAVPFYFYDEFMEFNGFYAEIEAMLADQEFQSDLEIQADELKRLRKAIRDASMPDWMIEALSALQESYPAGTSIRCRSSTNNEDLPGLSGAGLYDSRTQHPDEGHMGKCVKQVYASLWNFRAFAERDFHRINHLATAMAVLTHPNYSDERANGVAVSFDPIYGGDDAYYVNTQVGEDLVTNPDALSTPEEVLLKRDGEYSVIAGSNRLPPGQLIMSDAQLAQLRAHLAVIHERFAALYGAGGDERFAMEIEFKITREGALAIKQARPWVFR